MPFQPVPDREAERGADPGAARLRARRGRPRGGPGRVHGHDGLGRVDRDLHGQRRRPRRRRSRSTPSGSRRRRSPDAPRPPGLREAADHLVDIDQGGAIKTDVYAPDRYRGDPARGPGRRPRPEGLAVAGPQASRLRQQRRPERASSFPPATMTAAEVEALGIKPFEGGFIGPAARRGPGDGKFYTPDAVARPLLPDDDGASRAASARRTRRPRRSARRRS